MEFTRDHFVRRWVCPDYSKKFNRCLGLVELPPNDVVTLRQMVDDVLGEVARHGSQHSLAELPNLRNIAGDLGSQRDRLKYLSQSEGRVLAQAVEILERYAAAAEKARLELAIRENARKEHLTFRRSTAVARLQQALPINTEGDLVRIGCAMSTMLPSSAQRMDPETVRRTIRSAEEVGRMGGGNAVDLVSQSLTSAFHEAIRLLADEIANNHTQVDAVVDKVVSAIQERSASAGKAVAEAAEDYVRWTELQLSQPRCRGRLE
jgi:hypothetical protein